MIPSTFNSGEEGDFLIKVFVEKHWGDSNESDRMSFRLSSSSINSSSINSSANPSPDVTPDIRRRLKTATEARSQNLNAGIRRKKFTKSFTFSRTVDEDLRVLRSYAKDMKIEIEVP